MDLLLRGGTLVTCDAQDRVLEADVLVRGRSIEAVVARGGRLPRSASFVRELDAHGCAVIPGFVQAHVHLCQALLRGSADDLPLLAWLRERIWPLEAAHDEYSLRASAELGLLEMMLAGTTSILDMGTVHEHDVVMDACERSGVRAASGKAMMDTGEGIPERLRESTADSLAESERLCGAWQGKGDGRIGYAFAPRFVLSCTEALVRGAVDRAKDAGAFVHTHAAEHPGERDAVRAALGADDVDILAAWGVTGPRAVLAHGVQITEPQARKLAQDGTRLVHCPSANLKLGSGIAPVAEFDALGVALALGCDGAPCNNNMDPWVEMRHAALLAKIRTGVDTLPAKRALRLATIDGARALGLEALTGSIEEGKRADLAVVRIDGPHAEPASDVISKLVYACGARDVRHVLVDGALVVKNGEHQRFDAQRVTAKAREQAKKLFARAGL